MSKWKQNLLRQLDNLGDRTDIIAKYTRIAIYDELKAIEDAENE